jgi:hypothetical protein
MDTHATLLSTDILGLHAAVLDDLETVRKANGSRHGSLTGLTPDGRPWVPDKDGETRVYGLPFDDLNAVRFRDVFTGLAKLEADAIDNLEKAVRKHPLGPWLKKQRGLGDKQAGRLLAAIGDPFWRRELVHFAEDGETVLKTVPEGPRTVSALWAYAGLHVLPGIDLVRHDTHGRTVGVGAQAGAGGDSGQLAGDAHGTAAGVAARRRKGVKANWSTEAKTRAYLCAESCIKQLVKPCHTPEGEKWAWHDPEVCKCSRFRVKYDRRKQHTTGTRPDWTDGHRHNDGLRVASKEILKELWREARRLHCAFDPELAKTFGEADAATTPIEASPPPS